MNILKYAYRKLIGETKWAIKHGMTCGKNFTQTGGVDFGSEPYLITIGDSVRFSNSVQLITHDGGTWAFRHEEGKTEIVKFGRIVIGDYTFVGARAIILPGVHIGKNCVIGTGSVVTHDVPDRTVVAGVPARVVCTTDEYAEKLRAKMPEGFDPAEYHRNKVEYLKKILK